MARRPQVFLLVTCEHGGNRVPSRWRSLFTGGAALLASHRGLDIGSLAMAGRIAAAFGAPLIASRTTRLLVDLNRSIGHPRLFSAVTRPLPRAERDRILARHYEPYRREVESSIARHVTAGRRVLHVSSHSFTPELDGEVRNADVGLLYDPSRRTERRFCDEWHAALAAADPALRVRRNYPYPGKADGLTTHLRRLFPGNRYLGIELEVNQRHPLAGGTSWRRLQRSVIAALAEALH
jgi:predicted N-formylglutamate amidohydrolase